MKKLFVVMIYVILLFSTGNIYADDNADTGEGDTQSASNDRGFYKSSEYMYKVSLYVGLTNEADEMDSLAAKWKQIGNNEVYIKPASFSLESNVTGSDGSKIDYQNGIPLSPMNITRVIDDNPPAIPITHKGNIDAVKSYFGDTGTLNMLINEYALQEGVSREELVSSLKFTIEGSTTTYPPSEILPIKVNGKYQNKVPWLIVYEPVVLTHLKDNITILAFTATEYALAQKLGYFNFKSGTDGQYVSAMTYSDLPNSIILEQSWFGYPVTTALADGVHWSEDRIIQGGGWGMRILRPNSEAVKENDTSYDYEYRVDTDVITSVRIYAQEDITPDNRHESAAAYKNPTVSTATVTLSANGYSKSTEVVIPKGGSELVWIKWHTPMNVGEVNIQVQVTGNADARIEGGFRSATMTAKVVDLAQNSPPNPTADDRDDNFELPTIPEKANKTRAEWGTYTCNWIPNWVWTSKWEWESDWQYLPKYDWVYTIEGWEYKYLGMFWEDFGSWVDHGEWIDEGKWFFDYINYYATLSTTMDLSPDKKVPTAISDTMKSGYGVNLDITSSLYTNAPNSHLTYVQNAIAYFPEFHYKSYWRLLDNIGNGAFELKQNKYSTYNNRTHFTPIYYPDGPYEVYAEVIDLWTPAGMLRMTMSDTVNIQGSLFDDWHIGAKKER